MQAQSPRAVIDGIGATWPSNFTPALGLSLGMRPDADFAATARACIGDDTPAG